MQRCSPGYSASTQLAEAVGSRRTAAINELAAVISTAFPHRPSPPPFEPSPPAESRLAYALVHHVYETMKSAQAEQRADTVKDALRLWEMVHAGEVPAGVQTLAGPVVVFPSEAGVELPNLGDMPVWAPSADAGSASDGNDLGALVGDAVRSATDAGYGWLLQTCLAVVVMLRRRAPDESTSSWTVSRLPCTLYTDYYLRGALFAKDLVHESAHSWLNECIAVADEALHGPAIYWSPWKRRDRTAFGIIHSAFAFSCVTNLLATLRKSTDDPIVTTYCDARVRDERARLLEARPGIEEALATVRSDAIRGFVEAELAAAVGNAR